MARPSPVPPYLRLVLPSACWNASKMICCLSGGDADAGIGHRERDHVGRAVQILVVRGSSPRRPARSRSVTWPWCVNLKAFDSRFFRTCCRRFASVDIDFGRSRIEADEEVEVLRFGDVAESALDIALQLVEHAGRRRRPATVPDSIFDRSRMSLMSISRSLPDEWIVLANSTCFGVRLPSGLLRQLVGQDQQAVERRAQLVRHVGQELGLVLRGERELLGLFFQRLAGLLDFLVLALDFLVLVRQQPRLLLELLVGLLQFLLTALQLLRERLRLREQVFGPRVGLDRVDARCRCFP